MTGSTAAGRTRLLTDSPANSHTLAAILLLVLSVQSGGAVNICPLDQCYCFSNSEIDCYDMKLSKVLPFRPVNITYAFIDMSKNRFKRIQSDAFKSLKVVEMRLHKNRKQMIFEENAFRGLEDCLETLDVEENKIHTVPKRLFRRMKKLKSVSLGSNKMQYLPEMGFHGAENLDSLNLETNELKTIKSWTFRGLKNLKKMNLAKNDIGMVESRAFIGLRSLEILDLDHNNIRDLQPNTFRRLSQLKILDLSSNSISALFPLMFRGLKALGTLDLTNNPIITIADNTFRSMDNLARLSIRKAKLSSLKSGMFRGLRNLRVLDLFHNNIHDLPDDIFSLLKNINKIMLQDNELKTLNACAFKNLPSLKEIYVSDNKIYCDCAVAWTSFNDSAHVYGKCWSPQSASEGEISDPSRYPVCTFSGMECDTKQNQPLPQLYIRYRRAHRQQPWIFYGKR